MSEEYERRERDNDADIASVSRSNRLLEKARVGYAQRISNFVDEHGIEDAMRKLDIQPGRRSVFESAVSNPRRANTGHLQTWANDIARQEADNATY
jgi:hypothetical protein